ncbi:MAG: histidinol-phosphate transaminase [Candidatus Velthaea sp.]|jgi:histidinol-phosphate aminotransferase
MRYENLLRPAVRFIKPYTAGTTVNQAKARFGLEHVVKLSSNENPLGASPRALAALSSVPNANIYVDDDHPELRTRLGERHGLGKDHVIVGHGSNDVLLTLFATFVAPGDEVVLADPTFSLFAKNALLFDAVPVRVPLREGVHDLHAMQQAVTPKTKLVIVCDPNNPTGTRVEGEAFARFAAELPPQIVLVIDQAYREYMPAGSVDGVDILRVRPTTVVTRTLSKLYGLAAVRFGYGLSEPALIAYMQRVRTPFNVSGPAARAALAALDDAEFVARTLETNIAGKAFLEREFTRLGLRYFPTAANFFAVSVPVSATAAYDALLERGIVVRSGDGLGLPEHLRITIGTQSENEALIAALDPLVAGWTAAPARRLA